MDSIKIRPYQSSDYESVGSVHDAARKIELALASLDDAFLPFSIAAEREDFFEYPHIDVAVANGEVAGFSAYTDEELAWLYVAPGMMRRKIGSRLVAHALRTEPKINAIEVLLGNEPAKQLYATFGFYIQEIVEGVMPGNESFPVRVYCMCRKESGQPDTTR